MRRLFYGSVAALALAAAGAATAEDQAQKKNDGRTTLHATITQVDAKNHTLTVRIKGKDGREVDKKFQLTEDLQLFDQTGKVIKIDVFEAGKDVLVVEREGRIVEMHKPRLKERGDRVERRAERREKRDETPKLSQAEQFLREYDANKDGYLQREELPASLRDRFEQLDTDKDGKLSLKELERGIVHLQQRRRPSDLLAVLVELSDCDECCQEELQAAYDFLRKLDKNNNGKIDLEELVAARKRLVEERVDNILKDLDTNKDGKISREEARGQIRKHFDELDTNKDGFVDRNELLKAAMEQLPAKGKGEKTSADKQGHHSDRR